MTTLRLSRCAILRLVLAAFFLSGCGTGEQREVEAVDADVSRELADGAYSCTVINTTRGNGSYTLDCEKSGSEVVVNFNNGGHITLEIESQDVVAGATWVFEGANVQNGETWEVSISR